MRITKKLLSLLLALVMVLGLLPITTIATEEDVVYLSVSLDDKYIDDKNGTPIVYRAIPLAEIAAIDLTEYGLENMWFDGALNEDGTYQPTALQLMIYAHEELYGGDWSDVSFDALPGSSYFKGGIFGFTENLVYFHNGDFPLDESQSSWYEVGATSDRIVLEAGDFLDVASFSCFSFLWDMEGGFHLFGDENGEYVHDYTANAGEALTVKLMHSFCDLMYGIAWQKESTDYEVFYGSTFGEAEGSVVTDGSGNAEILFEKPGTYYVWCEGGHGSDDGTHSSCDYYMDTEMPCYVSSPAYAKVTVTGEEDPDYVALFKLAGSTMTLGNTLEINFVINNSDIQGEGNYVVITKQYADERGLVTKTIKQDQWKPYGADGKYVSFTVSAKEMNDPLTATVYNAEGEQISEVYHDSVAGYCVRMLGKEAEKDTPDAKKMALYVDMVNYGAAAQVEWEYNVENLANAALTEKQQALATAFGETANILVKGTGYVGTTLSLKENILLNVVFQNATIDKAVYAMVSYTDYNGNLVSYKVENFTALGAAMKYVQINTLKVADYAQAVTVQLYDAEGNVLSSCIESVESYLTRNMAKSELNPATMSFCIGSYNYLQK